MIEGGQTTQWAIFWKFTRHKFMWYFSPISAYIFLTMTYLRLLKQLEFMFLKLTQIFKSKLFLLIKLWHIPYTFNLLILYFTCRYYNGYSTCPILFSILWFVYVQQQILLNIWALPLGCSRMAKMKENTN